MRGAGRTRRGGRRQLNPEGDADRGPLQRTARHGQRRLTPGSSPRLMRRPGPVEVTLRKPPPLDTALTAATARSATRTANWSPGRRAGAGRRGGAAGRPGEAAAAAAPTTPVRRTTLFPPATSAARRTDGLRLFPGRLPDGRTAAPLPHRRDVVARDGVGGAGLPRRLGGAGQAGRTCSAGSRRGSRAAAPGDECVVTGALVGEDGRKAGCTPASTARPARCWPRPGHLVRAADG